MSPNRGQLLIAEPSSINDDSFSRSIILLVACNTEGSVGFIMNKPSDYTLKSFIPDIQNDFVVYIGGPVEQQSLYFIHTRPDLIDNSLEISKGLYWGGNFQQVIKKVENQEIKFNEIKFFLGYSGWATNQLEDELQNNSWLLTDNSYRKSLLVKSDSDFWKEKMIELGGDYSLWANAPEDPSLN
ncbi:MAG TPA: YqgE/AlgH family protein [Flavobacteriaceae bacterium]|nr:YqgE/AlgH family protein [Flavobacteriaceae bacterium]